jgi:hypothetical protein
MKLFIVALTLMTVNAFAAEYKIPNVTLNTSDFKIAEDEHSPNPVKYSQDGSCKLEKIVDQEYGYTTIYIHDRESINFEAFYFKQDRSDLEIMVLDFLKPNKCDFDVRPLKNGNYNLNNKCKEGLNSEDLNIEFDNDGFIKALSIRKQRFGSGHSIPVPAMSVNKIKCQF